MLPGAIIISFLLDMVSPVHCQMGNVIKDIAWLAKRVNMLRNWIDLLWRSSLLVPSVPGLVC